MLIYKPDRLTSLFVSVLVILDVLPLISISLIFFYIVYGGDPPLDSIGQAAEVMPSEVTASRLAIIAIIFCLISLGCWLISRSIWWYAILVTGKLIFAVSLYWLIMSKDLSYASHLVEYPLYISLTTNSLLFTIIVFDLIKAKLILQSKNA